MAESICSMSEQETLDMNAALKRAAQKAGDKRSKSDKSESVERLKSPSRKKNASGHKTSKTKDGGGGRPASPVPSTSTDHSQAQPQAQASPRQVGLESVNRKIDSLATMLQGIVPVVNTLKRAYDDSMEYEDLDMGPGDEAADADVGDDVTDDGDPLGGPPPKKRKGDEAEPQKADDSPSLLSLLAKKVNKPDKVNL